MTGANGHLGRALIRTIGRDRPVRALVRSERSAGVLEALPETLRPEIRLVDPGDAETLRREGAGCETWVHLIGILKEGGSARYEDAHEHSCEAVARAAAEAGARRIVYLSILGSRPDSPNACLASKGRAEEILRDGSVPVSVLRVPMVLGPGEQATYALRAQARDGLTALVRGGKSLEQPIDNRDVVRAILAADADRSEASADFDLAGPETLSHRELVLRVAGILGTRPRFLPVPLALVRTAAAALELVSANPPLTRAMLDVLEMDDCIDPEPAARRLGISLTPLEDTLRHVFAAPRKARSAALEAP